MNSILKFLVLWVSFLTALNADQTEAFKLELDVPESRDMFGAQVALSGDRAVVSAPRVDRGVGRVYVYNLLTKELLLELKPSETSEDRSFGYAMAASEKYVLVSAINSPTGTSQAGNAYLFDLETGIELFQFPQVSPTPQDALVGVDVSENFALVAYRNQIYENGHHPSDTCALSVYDTKTGEHIRTLTTDVANSRNSSDRPAFAMFEGKVLVLRSVDGTASFATIFDIASGEELVGLVFGGDSRWDYAQSVAFNEYGAIVGFPQERFSYTGIIQIYDTSSGELTREIRGADLGVEPSAKIGKNLSISGPNLLIGPSGEVPFAYLIDLSDEGSELIKLTTLNKQSASSFASSVAILGNMALVGEPGRDKTSVLSDTGAVYVFDVDTPPDSGRGDLANISTRGTVLNGDGILVGGFVIVEDARRVLIRGLGPTLGEFGVAGALSDSQMTVFRQGGGVVASNDNWGDQSNTDTIVAVSATVGAFPLAEDSLDAVMLLDLAPGAYTVHLTGVGDATGIGLIEVYRVP